MMEVPPELEAEFLEEGKTEALDASSFKRAKEVFVLPMIDILNPIEKRFWEGPGEQFLNHKYLDDGLWDTLKGDIEKHWMFKVLFTFIFPLDKILSFLAIRNSIAFDKSIEVLSDLCLSNKMFSTTEEQILFLLDWAKGMKESDEDPYVYNDRKMRARVSANHTIDEFKAGMKKVLSGEKESCDIKNELIAEYINAITEPLE